MYIHDLTLTVTFSSSGYTIFRRSPYMVYGPCLCNAAPRGWSPMTAASHVVVELSVHQNRAEIGLISEADRTQKYAIIVKDIFDVVRPIK